MTRIRREFFSRSPQAYFIDNIKHAASGTRTPPDWWRDLRKQEEAKHRHLAVEEASEEAKSQFNAYLAGEGKEEYERLVCRLVGDLRKNGRSEAEARADAERIAHSSLRARFHHDHPEWASLT